MKNNHSFKAIAFFAILIILCYVSIIFININKKESNALLETLPQIKNENKFTPRESKKDFENFLYLNNLGGSYDETLLNSFVTEKNIVILFTTNSNDFDLCENKNKKTTLSISIFDSNGSLLKIKYLGEIDEYIDSYINDDFIYIFYNKDTFGFETKIDFSLNTESTKKHNYQFDKTLLISNHIIYIYRKETSKTLVVLNNIFNIPTNYYYFTNLSLNNKDYIIFSYLNNFCFYNIQENSFSLTLNECEIIDILSTKNEILMLFKINNDLIFSKFNEELKEVFSTHISTNDTNKAKILTKNNSYVIYEINNTEINSYFICLHGDIIETKKQINLNSFYKNIILNKNSIILFGNNKSDNFFITILNEVLTEKKYMALSISTIYNYNLHIKDNVAIFITTTSFNNFEFIDNFGNKDIFLFIK